MGAARAEPTEIETSTLRTLKLAGLGVLMTTISAAVAFNVFADNDVDLFSRAICGFGMLFFGYCTVVIVWRGFKRGGTTLTITEQGICDPRIAAEIIPWTAIRAISTWEYAGQRALVLNIDPAVEAALHLSPIARWTRSANRALGADGLCITAQGLTMDYDELFELVRQHVPHALA